jgi:hypothetical protein
MKGQIFALSETFVKILSVASLAVVLMAIFFSINQYKLIYTENKGDRESLVVGSTVMSSCIANVSTSEAVKGLLNEDNIKLFKDIKNQNIYCLKYSKAIYVEIYDGANHLLYGFGNAIGTSSACQVIDPVTKICRPKSNTYYTIFPASLNRSSTIIPVNVNIYLGA